MRLRFTSILLLFIVAAAAISSNCVQKTPQAGTATPLPSLTPTPVVIPSRNFSEDEAYAIGDAAIDNPYVRARCIKVGWRDISDVPVKVSDVRYQLCREVAGGYNATRVLPEATINVGNASQAGIDVVAFLDQGRVAYIGFVPRPGANATGSTFYSTEYGVSERVPGYTVDRVYQNVTILDTGYVEGQNLSHEEDMVIRSVAVGNETVKKLLQGHSYTVKNVTISSGERGYPERYIQAYPVVSFEVKDGGSVIDSFDVLVDGRAGQVLAISHKSPWEY